MLSLVGSPFLDEHYEIVQHYIDGTAVKSIGNYKTIPYLIEVTPLLPKKNEQHLKWCRVYQMETTVNNLPTTIQFVMLRSNKYILRKNFPLYNRDPNKPR